MTSLFSDPLTVDTVSGEKSYQESSTSHSDHNLNIVRRKDETEKKKYDFLVCNHSSNQLESNLVYEEMERLGLRGYKYERDKVAGQYKLSAMEEAIKNTETIIVLLSQNAILCHDFIHKMNTTVSTSENGIIPIYIGMKKKDAPRSLRHHVDIPYKNTPDFWTRLHLSITRPKRDVRTMYKTSKQSHSSKSSSVAKCAKPIKIVPETRRVRATYRPSTTSSSLTATSTSSSCPSESTLPSTSSNSSKRGGLWSWFQSRKSGKEEKPMIQMEPVGTEDAFTANSV